ncbi:Putative glycosyltransferase EpsF [Peribacillus frigoritolerans]|uniref:glycosyltransferase family 1 protein n=1 Tax=Peribacillus frigoritolerans TaxID=450367 RepID=UPI0030CCA00C
MNRVLQVIGSLNNGGSQAMVMSLYRNIDRSKIQFDFIYFHENEIFFKKEIESLGGKVYLIPNFNGKNIYEYWSAWKNFFNEHPEYKLIHGHVRSTASIYLHIAKKNGLTTIAHSHNTSNGVGFSAFVKKCFQYPIKYVSDYLFACSVDSGKWLYGERTAKKREITVINNAIDSKQYVFNKDIRNRLRKELGIEGKFVIGHVGRFFYPKNHDYMIDIFNSVQKLSGNAVLILVGQGDLQEFIKEKVKKLGLEESVRFLNIRSDVPDLMQAMDLFLFPSIHEGLPVALVEAQATGMHCVVSNTVSTEIALTDLIDYVDLEESSDIWAKKILSYDNSYERKNTQSQIVNAGFDIENAANLIEEFYIERIESTNGR